MTELFVTNSLNYNKTVKFNLTLRYFVIKGEYGEHMWVLEVATTHTAADGSIIPSKKVHTLSGQLSMDELIQDAVAELCTYIDWTPFVEDKYPPFVDDHFPEDGANDVSIESNIHVSIKDVLPAAGVDLSNMQIILNNSMTDVDITNDVDVTGDPYELKLFWKPTLRVYDTYE